MKYLFNYWDRVSLEIQNSSRVFLFFDYDGTLTPIVSTPGKAKFPSAVKTLIRKLQKNPKFTVAVISGRSLKDVKKMVGLKGIIYAGNHGMEIEGKGIKFLKPIPRALIQKIAGTFSKSFKHIKGIIVEDKGATLSVHYRLAKAEDKPLIKNRFKKITAPFVDSGSVRISSGKEVLEVRPDIGWDKGMAVKRLLKRRKKALPFYVGDDVTDTDAFRAIKGKGISIFVGRPKKSIKADYFLKNPPDVGKFIERLLKL